MKKYIKCPLVKKMPSPINNIMFLFKEDIDKIIEGLFQKHIRLYFNNKIFRDGKLILFKHGYFVYEFILQQNGNKKNKKIEIPYPFSVENCLDKNKLYFDYRLNSFANQNKIIYNLLKKTTKRCYSNFYDKVLEIRVINEI
jgi:hypothetical protein